MADNNQVPENVQFAGFSTPIAAAAITIGAVLILVILNRGFRGVTVGVGS